MSNACTGKIAVSMAFPGRSLEFLPMTENKEQKETKIKRKQR